MSEHVILVDEQDNHLGTAEKIEAHRKAQLHRAFSVFAVADSEQGPMTLLQRRALSKYHCGGLWSNTCCSHPRPEESIQQAAIRRMPEEIGLSATHFHKAGDFIYQAKFDNGLTEHEFDHVLLTYVDKSLPILLNDAEVMDTAWMTFEELLSDIDKNAHLYTPWLKPAATIAYNAL